MALWQAFGVKSPLHEFYRQALSRKVLCFRMPMSWEWPLRLVVERHEHESSMNLAASIATVATGPLIARRPNLTRPSNAKVSELLGNTGNTRQQRFLRFAAAIYGIYGFASKATRGWKETKGSKGSKETIGNSKRQSNEEIQRLLTPMIRSSRLERAKEVLSQRNQGTRLVFCSLYEADVIACLRTMDLFGIQFGEIIGEWTETGDTSGGAKSYVTLRHWPDLRSCVGWLTEAVQVPAKGNTEIHRVSFCESGAWFHTKYRSVTDVTELSELSELWCVMWMCRGWLQVHPSRQRCQRGSKGRRRVIGEVLFHQTDVHCTWWELCLLVVCPCGGWIEEYHWRVPKLVHLVTCLINSFIMFHF